MQTIGWSALAQRDLRNIFQYIAQDSRKNAVRMLQRIKMRAEGIRTLPEAGAVVPEDVTGELLEIQVRPYRVIYWTCESTIEVATVVHSARELPDLSE